MRARPLLATALCLGLIAAPVPGRAEGNARVDALVSALMTDSSYRVKSQAALVVRKLGLRDPRIIDALIEATRDPNATVRAVCAETLGKLGDARAADALRALAGDPSPQVRSQAERALAGLSRAPAHDASAELRYYVEVSPIAAGKADPQSARLVRAQLEKELGRVGSLTIDAARGGGLRSYFVDGTLTAVKEATDISGQVVVSCDANLTLGPLPERAIKMMATVGASVPSNGSAADLEGARRDCLIDVARQISEKVQAFLATQGSR